MPTIIPVLCDVRSLYNVGSIFRTAEGLGIKMLYTAGNTPHMRQPNETRLPHIVKRAERHIAKTALGAEELIENPHFNSYDELIRQLGQQGFTIAALEKTDKATELFDYKPPEKLALLLGPEVGGLTEQLLNASDEILAIPMLGKKQSFNVSVAAGIALSYLSLHDKFETDLST